MRQLAGRFAPSPTGPLHFGSLLAAAASHMDARSRAERWLLRIDDLDSFRNVAGAEAAILRALEAHGLHWDGPIIRQSERLESYAAALKTLDALDAIFYCSCSRSDLKGQAIYPGTCRQERAPRPDTAILVRVSEQPITITDLVAGERVINLARDCGDFIVRRRDGLIAYQLATAVDDGADEIGRVIRGGDLLDVTPRQIHLMHLLGLKPPQYGHLPTLVQADGQKLSKHTHAPALDNSRATENLLRVFPYLALEPPADAGSWVPAELLAWGAEHWALENISGDHVEYRY